MVVLESPWSPPAAPPTREPDQDLVPGLPDAAANAVLAVGMDLDAAVTRPDRLLDFRLQCGCPRGRRFHAGG